MTFSVALKTVNKKNSILRGILTYLCYNVPLGLTYIVTKKIVKIYVNLLAQKEFWFMAC